MGDSPELEPGREQELLRAHERLAERTRELDLLQELGRRAAEARSPADLFGAVIALLHRAEPLDLVLAAYEWEGLPRCSRFLSRPVTTVCLEAIEERARRFLGWTGEAQRESFELAGYDGDVGSREAVGEEELLLLPLLRADRPVACLLAVPAVQAPERRLRLLYSATNQLSLHLERILTVQEAEADRFRSIVDAMPQGVVLTDLRLRVLQANRSAARMLAPIEGRGPATLDGKLENLGLGKLAEAVLSGQRAVTEGEARPGDDQVWAVTVSRHSASGATADGLVFVLTEVTESRRLQQQLAQSEKLSSLGQMISGVTHELNNPLASIVGYAQLLRRAGVDERTGRQLDVLGREADRCRKIVRNFLSFARRREPERTSLSLNQIVTNVAALLEYQMRVDDVALELELSPRLPAMQGDPHQLEQMLVNLLTNAAHAIRQDGRAGRVAVSTGASDAGIELVVEDDGPGVPEAVREKIFDPFFTTKAPGQGTGLGLSLVYGIVSSHGGQIELVRRDAPGTAFRIVFPVGAVANETREAAPPPPTTAEAGRPGRILVVDDDPSVAGLICDALEAEGHATVRARNGQEALERLDGAAFDLIVSDVKMPTMDGEQLHERLRRSSPGMARRMLLTTGDTLGNDPDEIGSRTGLDVLGKPFDVEELRRRVRARLDGSDR